MSGLFQLDEDTLNAGGFACDVINMALHWGVLVPDIRLQAIADAWNIDVAVRSLPFIGQHDLRIYWPELAALLDALEGGKS